MLSRLYGNPVCSNNPSSLGIYCQIQQKNPTPYSTSLERCGTNQKVCSGFQKLSPASCECQVPYEGRLTFRAPSFRDLTNANLFGSLEDSLCSNLSLPAHSAFLQNPFFDQNDYLQVQLSLFPPSGKFFSHSDVQRIGFRLSNQTFKPSDVFGPYLFNGFAYPFPGNLSITPRQMSFQHSYIKWIWEAGGSICHCRSSQIYVFSCMEFALNSCSSKWSIPWQWSNSRYSSSLRFPASCPDRDRDVCGSAKETCSKGNRIKQAFW